MSGYVIRGEEVVQGENYKNGIEQIKTEGEKVAKNESIFRYYSKSEQSLKQKISELDVKIQEAMSQETNIYPADMKIIDEKIDEKMKMLNTTTDILKLTEYKKEINSLITKKANIAGDTSPKGSYLKQLINERKEYENQLNSGAEYVNAPISGIISYKVDGLEGELKPTTECFSMLTKSYLEGLNLKTGKIVATSEEKGKIIDNTSCYIATVSNSEGAKNTQTGKKVKIRLQGNMETTAEIVYKAEEENGDNIIVLKIEKFVSQLCDYRKISFDLIWWSDTGLKVPNEAIVKENDLSYVVRNRTGYLTKMLIKVNGQNDKYSIVRPYETEELKDLAFSTSEINRYRKITLYDEILLTPDLSKVE